MAEKSFVNAVKSGVTNETNQQSEFYKMMMSVRDSYTARTGIRGEPEKVEGKKFDRKPSALSNASTVSVGSGGKEAGNKARKSLSRGEMLRNMSGINRSCSVAEAEDNNKKDATEAVLRAEKESLILAKTESASEFEERIGDHGTNTESLIDTLSEILRDITKAPEDVVLAGYSEACISVLLKHLDTSGMTKQIIHQKFIVKQFIYHRCQQVQSRGRSDLQAVAGSGLRGEAGWRGHQPPGRPSQGPGSTQGRGPLAPCLTGEPS